MLVAPTSLASASSALSAASRPCTCSSSSCRPAFTSATLARSARSVASSSTRRSLSPAAAPWRAWASLVWSSSMAACCARRSSDSSARAFCNCAHCSPARCRSSSADVRRVRSASSSETREAAVAAAGSGAGAAAPAAAAWPAEPAEAPKAPSQALAPDGRRGNFHPAGPLAAPGEGAAAAAGAVPSLWSSRSRPSAPAPSLLRMSTASCS
mmetsp:Transcript_16669/g.51276  ORF Transcript_16669/g.51276 Transcript_16669/m.51276 type:complete len:211 (-) Transcript_16669:165-797(-)